MADVGNLGVRLSMNTVKFDESAGKLARQMSTMKLDFQLAAAKLKDVADGSQVLALKSDSLSQMLAKQGAIVERMNTLHQESIKEKGEDARATENLAIKLAKSKLLYQNMQDELSKTNKELDEYRRGVDNLRVNESIAKLGRDFEIQAEKSKLAIQRLDLLNDSSGMLENKSKTLSRQIEIQNKIIENEKKLFEECARAKGEDAQETQELNLKVIKAEQTLAGLEKQLKETNKELGDSKNKLLAAQKNLEEFSSSTKKVGEGLKSAGQNLSMYVTAPLIGVGVASVKTANDFEAQMSRVKAISGATGEEFAKLKDLAIKLGADTSFSSKQAAEGMENLASAGFKNNEIMSAMPGMLDLAASGGIQLAEASDIAASSLRAFNLDAGKAGHVADVMAKAAADTNANITDMGYSMKYAAPVAHTLGITLENTAAAIGIMANAGIKGEQAGTTLRGALVRLADPPKEAAKKIEELNLKLFDSSGKMNSLDVIVGKLQNSMKNMTQEQKAAALSTIFGTEALSGMMVLVDGGPNKLKELTVALEKSDGAAKAMASTMKDNVKGSIEQMQGSLEGAGIAIGTALAPTITGVAEKVTEMANAFAKLDPEQQKFIISTGVTVAAIGPVLVGVGSLITAVSSLSSFIALCSGAIAGAGGFAGVLAALSGPVGWTILGIAGITAGGIALYNHMKQDLIPAVELFGDSVSANTKKAVGGYMELNKSATEQLNLLNWSGQTISKETSDKLIATFDTMGNTIKQGFDDKFNKAYQVMVDFFAKSSTLSAEEEQKALEKMRKDNEDKKKVVEDGQVQIREILNKASNEKRALTEDERKVIGDIQSKMKDQSIKVLSENEVEARSIMERMKQQAGNMTAIQAAEVVANMNKQYTGTVDAANKQYDQSVQAIIRMRDESKSITTEQANALIAEAERQKNDTIKKASDMRAGVVAEAKEQAKEHVKEVNWETGQILSDWDKLKNWVDENAKKITDWFQDAMLKAQGVEKARIEAQNGNLGGDNAKFQAAPQAGNNANGTDSWRGGLTWVGEEGPELINLPKGTQIFSNPNSVKLMKAIEMFGNAGFNAKGTVDQATVDRLLEVAKGRALTLEEQNEFRQASASKPLTNLQTLSLINSLRNNSEKASSVEVKKDDKEAKEKLEKLKDELKERTEISLDWIEEENKRSNRAVDERIGDYDRILNYHSEYLQKVVFDENISAEDKKKIKSEELEFIKSTEEKKRKVFDDVIANLKQDVTMSKKQFELWGMSIDQTKDKSLYLAEQLKMQQAEQLKVMEQVDVAKLAYDTVVAKYGESSVAAKDYKERLIELQIEQAKTTLTVKQTAEAIATQNDVSQNKRTQAVFKFSDTLKEGLKYLPSFGYDTKQIEDWAKKVSPLPGFAKGVKNFVGGFALVGEEGPEIVKLPKGSDVVPNNKIGGMGSLNVIIQNHGTIVGRNGMDEFAEIVSRSVSKKYGMSVGGAW